MENKISWCLISIIISMVFSYAVHGAPFFRKDYTYVAETDSFYKISSTRLTWLQAKKRCALEGAALVVLEDQKEANAVLDFWQKTRKDVFPVWLGLSDLISEGNFVAVDGRSIDDVYSGWDDLQPDDSGANEDCAMLRLNAKMNDQICTRQYHYICKKAHATLNWNILCDIADLGYNYNNDLSKCYKFHQPPTNWNEAHTTCNAERSYLAIINSEKERVSIVKLLADKQKNNKKNVTLDLIHMGFYNRDGDSWITVKGSPLDSTGYEVWADQQPEHYDEPNYCGAINYSGELHDIACDKRAAFICEHDIDSLATSVDVKNDV